MNEIYWLKYQVAEESELYKKSHISIIQGISFFPFFFCGKLVGNSHFQEHTTNEVIY